jgi:hypothetical protein
MRLICLRRGENAVGQELQGGDEDRPFRGAPHFLDLPYQRRTHHGEEEEEKERKEVIDPIGSFPLRNTRGTR